MARALLKAREGDVVTVRTPAGPEDLEVLSRPLRAARDRVERCRRCDGRRRARLTRAAGPPYSDRMDQDLAALEQKLTSLIAHTRALRAANESLRRELAAAHERQRQMMMRMEQASARVDALIARMPGE